MWVRARVCFFLLVFWPELRLKCNVILVWCKCFDQKKNIRNPFDPEHCQRQHNECKLANYTQVELLYTYGSFALWIKVCWINIRCFLLSWFVLFLFFLFLIISVVLFFFFVLWFPFTSSNRSVYLFGFFFVSLMSFFFGSIVICLTTFIPVYRNGINRCVLQHWDVAITTNIHDISLFSLNP